MLKDENVFEGEKENSFRNWKSYFLDFFMLFLAVSLGFFADNIRENISENAKEKEYIISMIEDAELDKINIEQAIEGNTTRALHLDSVAKICINYNSSTSSHADLYRHYMFGLMHPDFISPTDRTMQQLKNAGGMRLIRNKTAADMFVLYNDKAKKLAGQQLYYERYQNQSIDFATQLFNFERYGVDVPPTGLTDFQDLNNYFGIIDNDKKKLMQFSNIVFVYIGVVKYYTVLLKEMHEEADKLIQTLKREYQLQ